MIEEKPGTYKKVWGYEVWLVNSEKYCGKLLLINKGAISSLHKHNTKTETFVCLDGEVALYVGTKTFIMKPNFKGITIQPGDFHRFVGIEKSTILEISTFHSEEDVERKDPSKSGEESWQIENQDS